MSSEFANAKMERDCRPCHVDLADLGTQQFKRGALPTVLSSFELSAISTRTASSDDVSQHSDEHSGDLVTDVSPMIPYAESMTHPVGSDVSASGASSLQRYGEPSQTVIFLDWDDTLFPTTQIFDRWRVSKRCDGDVPEEIHRKLETWRDAVYDYVSAACALSEGCFIVTNAKRPWVEDCVARFVPALKSLFNKPFGGVRVFYADEAVASKQPIKSELAIACEAGCSEGAKVMLTRLWNLLFPEEEESEEGSIPSKAAQAQRTKRLTAGKRAAMEKASKDFYNQYPGQTWKNVLSFGDMHYEYEALRELTTCRRQLWEAGHFNLASKSWWRPKRECLRTKAIVTASCPLADELALHLQFGRLLLPALVRFDGNIDVDLSGDVNPLRAYAKALDMPQLATLDPPFVSSNSEIAKEQESRALDEAVLIVHEWMRLDEKETTEANGRQRTDSSAADFNSLRGKRCKPFIAGPRWPQLTLGRFRKKA